MTARNNTKTGFKSSLRQSPVMKAETSLATSPSAQCIIGINISHNYGNTFPPSVVIFRPTNLQKLKHIINI